MNIKCKVEELLQELNAWYVRGKEEGVKTAKFRSDIMDWPGLKDENAKLKAENEKLRACRDAVIEWREHQEKFALGREDLTEIEQAIWDAVEPFMQEAAQ